MYVWKCIRGTLQVKKIFIQNQQKKLIQNLCKCLDYGTSSLKNDLNTIFCCRGFTVRTIYTNAKNISTVFILYWVYEKKKEELNFQEKNYSIFFSRIRVSVQIIFFTQKWKRNTIFFFCHNPSHIILSQTRIIIIPCNPST